MGRCAVETVGGREHQFTINKEVCEAKMPKQAEPAPHPDGVLLVCRQLNKVMHIHSRWRVISGARWEQAPSEPLETAEFTTVDLDPQVV